MKTKRQEEIEETPKKFNYKPVWLKPEVHLKVKKLAVKKGVSMGDLIEKIINEKPLSQRLEV